MNAGGPALMTAEEFLALPMDDGVDRWLIRGRLRERPATFHDRWHSLTEANIAHLLGNWLDQQPQPRGELGAGEAGCILRRNPDTMVGIDVVYISPELAAQELMDNSLVEGVPTLAVEILDVADREAEINEKIDEYRGAGVPLLWVVNPHVRVVRVYRPNGEPELFNVRQEITGEPYLPGLRVPVAKIFER